jgi:hypothetical protein
MDTIKGGLPSVLRHGSHRHQVQWQFYGDNNALVFTQSIRTRIASNKKY